MPTIEITKGAIQHIVDMTGIEDRAEAEEILQVAISMCNIRDSAPSQAADDGVGDLLRVAKDLLKWRAKIHLICAPYRDEMKGLIFAFADLSTVVHYIRQGSASKSPDVGKQYDDRVVELVLAAVRLYEYFGDLPALMLMTNPQLKERLLALHGAIVKIREGDLSNPSKVEN